ncbi:hypothetical protein PMAYCL1PPCAC_26472, partial [Pristionchus mayeri]
QKRVIRNSGILPLVFKHLNDEDDDLLEQALIVLVNMTGCDDISLTQTVIDMGTLRALPDLMEKRAGNTSIAEYCCMLIGNVMGGSEGQKQALIDNGLLTMIIKLVQVPYAFIKLSLAFRNHFLIFQDGTRSQIMSVLAEKPMPALSAVLSCADDSDQFDNYTHVNVLKVIYKLLSTLDGKPLATLKEEMKTMGLERLKKLKGNTDEEVHNLASKILSEYFAENDEEETNEKLKRKSDEKADQNVQKRKR